MNVLPVRTALKFWLAGFLHGVVHGMGIDADADEQKFADLSDRILREFEDRGVVITNSDESWR